MHYEPTDLKWHKVRSAIYRRMQKGLVLDDDPPTSMPMRHFYLMFVEPDGNKVYVNFHAVDHLEMVYMAPEEARTEIAHFGVA